METFGQRLKSLRKPDEQKEIAAILGVASQTLGNYERDRNQPDFEKIWRICSHFGICPEWLIFGTGPKYRDEEKYSSNAPQQVTSCPGCAALERILQLERQERQALNKENIELREQLAQLKERLNAARGGDNVATAPLANTA